MPCIRMYIVSILVNFVFKNFNNSLNMLQAEHIPGSILYYKSKVIISNIPFTEYFFIPRKRTAMRILSKY